MILNSINAMTLAINLRIAKVGYMPLLKTVMLSRIPPKFGRRNKRRYLKKNMI
jgi:hypothetical protein